MVRAGIIIIVIAIKNRMMTIKEIEKIARSGGVPSADEILSMIETESVEDICGLSHRITADYAGDSFDTCSIINAKSGGCSEDCKWCAQSVFHKCNIRTYPMAGEEECVRAATANYESGISRFSIVTSGKRLYGEDVDKVCGIIRALRRDTNIKPCVSLGLVGEADMKKLADAGVTRYHCNIETSPSRFGKLCTTHTLEQKLEVLDLAVKYGIEPCSGGIIGMGETMRDRVEMALLLRSKGVKSIPLNVLNPIPGTPLEKMRPLGDDEFLLTVAVFRILNPDAFLRFSGGRILLGRELQKKALYAGINAAIMGNMLTTAGEGVRNDFELFESAGYKCHGENIRKHIWHPYSAVPNPFPVFKVASARGVRLRIDDGREIIDGMSSWWAAALGYNNPHLNRAACDQINKMSHVMFGGIVHDPAMNLTEQLLSVLPEGLDRIFYADSGSVSVEVAMKMAIQYQAAAGKPEKNKFVTIRGGYHGDTWNAMSVCDPVNGMHSLFGPSLPVNYFLPVPESKIGDKCCKEDISRMEEMFEKHGREIAAFILEPVVQGAGGMRFYSADYLVHARRICDRYGVLLIFDEIATGFGRTGKMFACEHAGVFPDIMTIGKALTGGYMTMAAAVTTERVSGIIASASPGLFMHGPTFMANPLACAVACEAVRRYKMMDLEGNAARIEAVLSRRLSELSELDEVADVRCFGAIGVVEMKEPVDMKTMQPMFVENGVWLRPFGKLVYTMPPFVISDADLGLLCDGIIRTVRDYAALINHKSI